MIVVLSRLPPTASLGSRRFVHEHPLPNYRGKSDGELRSKQFNRATNLRLQGAQQWHERRLTGIWRRYVDSVAGVNVEGFGRQRRRLSPRVNLVREGDKKWPFAHQDGQMSMLIRVGDVAEALRPLDSVIGLKCFNHAEVFGGKPLQ